ncbi:MAG: hypothetical protein LIO45_06440, partial [Clostridiales bacterium]|nr:hypothetical protein [Clostridiales bacterium]
MPEKEKKGVDKREINSYNNDCSRRKRSAEAPGKVGRGISSPSVERKKFGKPKKFLTTGTEADILNKLFTKRTARRVSCKLNNVKQNEAP